MPIDRLHPLVDRLLALGLLRQEAGDRPTYDVTDRGHEFLRTYSAMQGFIHGFSWIDSQDRQRRH